MHEFIKPNENCAGRERRNTSDIDAIRNMPESDVKKYIRNRLRFGEDIELSLKNTVGCAQNVNQHYRFFMDGKYAYNMGILLKFEDLGIFDYYEFLSLRFYKGVCYIVYGNAQLGEPKLNEITDLYGYGTVEIIYEIFKITILMKI